LSWKFHLDILRRSRENVIPWFQKCVFRLLTDRWRSEFICFLVWKSRREYREMVFGQSWSSDTTYTQACYIKMLEMKFSIRWYKSCYINHRNKKVSFIHNIFKWFLSHKHVCWNNNYSRNVVAYNHLYNVLKISYWCHESFWRNLT